jgi:hypothetical protein
VSIAIFEPRLNLQRGKWENATKYFQWWERGGDEEEDDEEDYWFIIAALGFQPGVVRLTVLQCPSPPVKAGMAATKTARAGAGNTGPLSANGQPGKTGTKKPTRDGRFFHIQSAVV